MPYCDHEFGISLRTADGTRLPVEKAELQVLPYARDVEIFDPDPHAEGKTNSQWTKIGEDFFGGLNYERIGILHMEQGWQVRYCVARCPQCKMLIDVFANLTHAKSLAEMWPHLLGKSADGSGIKPWQPTSILSRLFGEMFFVLVFLIMLYIGSLTPQILSYSHQTIFDADRFRTETMPVFLIRGIVVISVFFLVWLRKKMIELFGSQTLADLFDTKRELITYWANFAVCRFTGFQKEGRLFTPNAVMLLGGLSSSLLLLVTWLIIQLSTRAAAPDIPVMLTEVAFWLVISYLFGMLAWSFSVIPVYVFRGLKNIPMKVDKVGYITEFPLIERAGRYAVRGIYILIASAIAVSIFPVFITPFAELRAVLIWAQSALIVCFSILIIRFGIKAHTDPVKKVVGWAELITILMVFLAVRLGIGVSQTDGFLIHTIGWLGFVKIDTLRRYAELVVFSVLAAYLFYRLTRDVMFREIQETAEKNIFRWYDDKINEAMKRNDIDTITKFRAGAPPGSLRDRHEKAAQAKLQWITALLGVIGPIIAVFIEHFFFPG